MTEPTDAGPDPCPFCGSSNVVHYEVEGRDNHHFECCNCLASSMCKTTRQEALAAWNRRTPQPTQAQAGEVPLTDEQVRGLAESAGYWDGDPAKADFINGIRCAESAHGVADMEGGKDADA